MPNLYTTRILLAAIFLIAFGWLWYSISTPPKFSEVAFGSPGSDVRVLESDSEVVDNFFRSEYAYLIEFERSKTNWMGRLNSTSYNEIEDGQPNLRKRLVEKFSEINPKLDKVNFLHLGAGEFDREHYLLVLPGTNLGIYFVATI